ncbi:unnamed protein product, partial [Ectocarpus sp. 12 AP-2014]
RHQEQTETDRPRRGVRFHPPGLAERETSWKSSQLRDPYHRRRRCRRRSSAGEELRRRPPRRRRRRRGPAAAASPPPVANHRPPRVDDLRLLLLAPGSRTRWHGGLPPRPAS